MNSLIYFNFVDYFKSKHKVKHDLGLAEHLKSNAVKGVT